MEENVLIIETKSLECADHLVLSIILKKYIIQTIVLPMTTALEALDFRAEHSQNKSSFDYFRLQFEVSFVDFLLLRSESWK